MQARLTALENADQATQSMSAQIQPPSIPHPSGIGEYCDNHQISVFENDDVNADGRSVPVDEPQGTILAEATTKPGEIIDESEELSSRAGLLSVNAPNVEPHYFGSSSAYALSRLVSPHLRRLRRDPRFTPAMPNPDATLSTPSPLPGEEGREWLSRLYFEQIHPQHPILHEPTFRVWEMSVVNSGSGHNATTVDHVALFFVNMVGIFPYATLSTL